MPRKPIFVEETGHGWGVALGSSGRFIRVRVPPEAKPGDELPSIPARTWHRPLMTAAAVVALFLGSLALLLPRAHANTYALVTLRFAPASRPVQPAQFRYDEQQIQMTLALDQQGTVAAVRPEAQTTQKLLGMRVEQAIHHTVEQYTAIAGGDVQVRPRRDRPDWETADLEARIRTALPACEPPIEVEIGPPFEDGEEIAPPRETREKHQGGRRADGAKIKKGKKD